MGSFETFSSIAFLAFQRAKLFILLKCSKFGLVAEKLAISFWLWVTIFFLNWGQYKVFKEFVSNYIVLLHTRKNVISVIHVKRWLENFGKQFFSCFI